MTITTFIGVVYLICVTKLDDSLLGGGGGCSCSFKKREVKLRELWCLTPFLTIFQLYHGYLVLLVEYNHQPAVVYLGVIFKFIYTVVCM
jgi:hypothetical protein